MQEAARKVTGVLGPGGRSYQGVLAERSSRYLSLGRQAGYSREAMRNFDKWFPDDSRRARVLQARSLWPAPEPTEDGEEEAESALPECSPPDR